MPLESKQAQFKLGENYLTKPLQTLLARVDKAHLALEFIETFICDDEIDKNVRETVWMIATTNWPKLDSFQEEIITDFTASESARDLNIRWQITLAKYENDYRKNQEYSSPN